MDMFSDASSLLSSWVRLNVGGQTFVTSKQTLQRYSDSFLCSLCEGNMQSDKDETGAFLIDRNPCYFPIVLDYLRHGKLIVDKNISEEGVLEEAKFYNLPGLIKLCKERIAYRDHVPAETKCVYRLLQCFETELAGLIASISDGWKLQQVLRLKCRSNEQYLNSSNEYVCIVSKEYPEINPSLSSLNRGLPGKFLVIPPAYK